MECVPCSIHRDWTSAERFVRMLLNYKLKLGVRHAYRKGHVLRS